MRATGVTSTCPAYSETIDGQSVGDSSHLLPSDKDPPQARAPAASSPEAAAITAFVLRLQADYPVAVSIDLHEDNLINEGYVYSQGVDGAEGSARGRCGRAC